MFIRACGGESSIQNAVTLVRAPGGEGFQWQPGRGKARFLKSGGKKMCFKDEKIISRLCLCGKGDRVLLLTLCIIMIAGGLIGLG